MTLSELRGRVGRIPAPAWAGAAAAGAVVAGAALLLYVVTLLPGVAFWDTGEFQTVGAVLGIAHPTGFPTYTLLLWVASVAFQPFGDPALRANLLSAILVASACGALAAVVAVVTRRSLVGLATGLALAVAPTAWSVGLRADPHALHLLLVVVLLGLLVGWQRGQSAGPSNGASAANDASASSEASPAGAASAVAANDAIASSASPAGAASADRWLLAASLVYGLALGNHALTLLLAPGIGLFLVAVAPRMFVDRRGFVARCLGIVLGTAAAIYLYLPIRASMSPLLNYADPQSWGSFAYVVFAQQFHGSLSFLPPMPDMIATVVGVTLVELGPMSLLVPVGAFVALRRHRAVMALLTTWWVIGWLFALGYVNADIDRYYLMPLVASAVMAGIGAGAIFDFVVVAWNGVSADGAIPRLSAPAMVFAAILLIVPTAIAVPYRYSGIDASHDTSAQTWLNEALPQLEPNAVVVSWWSYSTTLWYGQYIEGLRPDVFVVDDRTMIDQHLGKPVDVIERYLGQRPVYVIRLADDLAELAIAYRLTPLMDPNWGDGVVYRVDGRQQGGG